MDSNKPYDNMDGHEFEYFCGDLLKKNEFSNVEVTRGSGDQGIDIIAYKDGVKYGIQCKCYSQNIGNKAVQEAFAGKTFYDCHVAAVLTNQYFTRSAKELAEHNGVLLWDRNKLRRIYKEVINHLTSLLGYYKYVRIDMILQIKYEGDCVMKNSQTPEATKTCKHCKSIIPKGAKVCPFCRKRQGSAGNGF
ncbi:MAG: restriction endonuclease [Roseburia intestinalis]